MTGSTDSDDFPTTPGAFEEELSYADAFISKIGLGGDLLLVSRTGAGSGTVTSDPAGIDCGDDCSEPYANGTHVTLTATPTAGSIFTGWSGACAGSGACILTLDATQRVTATFTRNTYTLGVTKSGTGSGTVTSAPAGIDCGSDCSENYPQGQSVTLTATPDPTSTFTGWGGACTGLDACTLTLDAAQSVTATFSLPTLKINNVSKAEGNSGTTAYTFTITLSPASTGTVKVKYATANGTATAGSDYTAIPATLLTPTVRARPARR